MNEETVRQNLFQLMKEKVYRYSEEEFTLASGRKSHHYFNCKEILLYPDRLSLLSEYIVNYFLPKINLLPESVGGLTMGADPISYSVSLQFYKNGKIVFPLVVRKEAKDHGTKKLIEGAISNLKTCLVVDDVITTGGSTLKAVEALRASSITVDKGICILDREEGGFEALAHAGVQMYSIFKKSDFGDEITRGKQ
jgi:orotate phosphoribosyltransferase